MRFVGGSLAIGLAVAPLCAVEAQDALRGLDMSSPDMTLPEMTRAQVEAQLAAAPRGQRVDFSRKRLSGLDLSGLDLSGAILRAARLNHANLSGANLDGAVLDQAWALGANLAGASLVKASLVATQLAGANLDGANLAEARITADMNRARLVGARLEKADCSVDLRKSVDGPHARLVQVRRSHRRRFRRRQPHAGGFAVRQNDRPPISRARRCARRTRAARICVAPFSRAPTRPASTSIPRESTARARPFSPRRSTSIAPIASETLFGSSDSRTRRGGLHKIPKQKLAGIADFVAGLVRHKPANTSVPVITFV